MHNEAPPPLEQPPRRARLLRSLRNLRHAYRSAFALVIFVFAGWAGLDAWRLYELTYGTVIANAIVTKKTAIPHGTQVEYRLGYAFTPLDGTPIVGAAVVTQPMYDSVVEGGLTTVVFLPSNPHVDHWLGDNDAARTHPRFMLICRGLAAIVASIVLMLIERPLRRELWLARNGLVTQGQILATGKGKRKRARPWITYSFRTVDGRTIAGKTFVPRATPAEALAVGQMVEVFYDPANPAWNKARLGMASIEFSAPPLAA